MGKAKLFGALNSVEHLKFDFIFRHALRDGPFDQLGNQRTIMRGHDGAYPSAARFGAEQTLGEMKIILVHILFRRVGDFGGFVVSAFDQADGGAHWNQAIQIFFRTEEIGLQADADVGIGFSGAAIQFEGDIHVGTLLHINPQCLVRRSVFQQRDEIFVTEFGIEIEAQLSELDGNFGAEPGGANTINHGAIMLRHKFRFRANHDVFAEVSEDGTNSVSGEAASGGERVLHVFSGHKTGDGAAHEAEARGVLAHPRALRSHKD